MRPAHLKAALAACLVLAAGVALAGQEAGPFQVTIKDFNFHPMAITVPAGAYMTWKNLDEEPHTVTSTNGAFRSTGLDGGDTFTVRFERPGVYGYVCTIHPRMRGTVTVK